MVTKSKTRLRVLSLISLVVAALTLMIAGLNWTSREKPESLARHSQPLDAPLVVTDDVNRAQSLPSNGGTNSRDILSPKSETLVDISLLQEMVESIPRDKDARLAYNGETRKLLDRACDAIGEETSNLDLNIVLQLVRASLPEEDGPEVARTIQMYCEYKRLEPEFLAQLSAGYADNPADNYAELSKLRKSYLGDTLAEQLFADEDRFFHFNLELLKLDANSDLSDEERIAMQKRLEEKYGVSSGP